MVNVDELQSFPFEVPLKEDGHPLATTGCVEIVVAYESGVDGIVIHLGGFRSHEAWAITHRPTGMQIYEAESFQAAVEIAAELEDVLGCESILAATDDHKALDLVYDWVKERAQRDGWL